MKLTKERLERMAANAYWAADAALENGLTTQYEKYLKIIDRLLLAMKGGLA